MKSILKIKIFFIFYDLSEEGVFKIYIYIYWYDELTFISSDLYLCYLTFLYVHTILHFTQTYI